MTRPLLAALLPFLFLLVATPLPGGERPFFAFQNGVRFDTNEARAEALAEIGYDGIGSATLPRDGDIDGFFKAYRDRGLRVFSFYTGGTLAENGPSPSPGLIESIPKLKGTEVVLELYLRGDRSKFSDEDAVEWIREVADLAAGSDLDIALYPHTGMFIETIGDAVRIAKLVARENVGVMFNLCHFLRIEPEADLREALVQAGPFLRQVSVSGADEGGTDWKTLIQPLGSGSYDLAPLVAILDEIGFTGPVGVQCFNIEGSSRVFLKQSFDAWQKLDSP